VKNGKKLLTIYKRLYRHFGPRGWWPGRTPFEVMVGAVLTQNAAWGNAEKAILNIKRERALSPKKIHRMPIRRLKRLIRPSGFFNEKAKKLKNLADFLLESCNGRIKSLKKENSGVLRNRLLGVNGIGPETADSILLYALEKPAFVVDAYTKRIFSRHRMIKKDAAYGEVRDFFMSSLPRRRALYNEYHALIVELGKRYCKKTKPLCNGCPLRNL